MPFRGLSQLMFGSDCLAIVVGLCLNQATDIKLEMSGLWAGSKISVGHTVLYSNDGGDNLPFPDRRKMSKVCVEGGCVHYHLYCEAMRGEVKCTIDYNQILWDHNRRIVIRSTTWDELKADIQSIKIVLSPGIMIPLNDFSELAVSKIPPYCRPSSDPGCS